MAVAEAPIVLDGHAARLEVLAGAVDAVAGVRIDELDDRTLEEELEVIESARRRLQARSCRVAETLTHRAARRAQQRDPRDTRGAQRAADQARRQLAGRLSWSPAQAKRAVDDGKKLASLPTAGAAADAGALSARHARVLADTLRHFSGERRAEVEAELVAAAQGQDVVAFGRTCRARLAEVDQDAAMADLERRHARRAASLTDTEDGMTVLWGRWAGLDAETVASAVHAFRRPDRPGEHRSPAQRTADAVVDAMAAALRAAHAPTAHGVRSHVVVTVPAQNLASGDGVAETQWTGPLPYREVRRLLDDAGISWLATTGDGLPMEAGAEKRNSPLTAGVRPGPTQVAGWRGLERPKGATRAQRTPRTGDQRRTTAKGPAAPFHHRRFDLHGWQVTWNHGRPTLHPPHPPSRPRDGPT